MIRTIAVLTLFAVLMITSCAWKDLKPATEVVYEGELIGNETVTYPSAEKVVEICMMTKAWSWPMCPLRRPDGAPLWIHRNS